MNTIILGAYGNSTPHAFILTGWCASGCRVTHRIDVVYDDDIDTVKITLTNPTGNRTLADSFVGVSDGVGMANFSHRTSDDDGTDVPSHLRNCVRWEVLSALVRAGLIIDLDNSGFKTFVRDVSLFVANKFSATKK